MEPRLGTTDRFHFLSDGAESGEVSDPFDDGLGMPSTDQCSGEHFTVAISRLDDRNRLASEQRFVDGEVRTVDEVCISGHPVAFVEDDAVTTDDVTTRNSLMTSGTHDECSGCGQVLERP